MSMIGSTLLGLLASIAAVTVAATPALAQKKPNIVMLMTDDTGWSDFGAYTGGGAALGPPDPEHRSHRQGRRNVHELVRPGKLHRGPRLVHDRAHSDPLRSVGGGRSRRSERPQEGNADDRRVLPEERLSDVLLRQVAPRATSPKFYPIEHGFDEMKHFAAYYPGVYAYSDTSSRCAPVVPEIQRGILGDVSEVVNLYEW